MRGQHGPPGAGSSSPCLCHFCHLALFAGVAASVWQSSKQSFSCRARQANAPPPTRIVPWLSPLPLFQPTRKCQNRDGFSHTSSSPGHLSTDGPEALARPHHSPPRCQSPSSDGSGLSSTYGAPGTRPRWKPRAPRHRRATR